MNARFCMNCAASLDIARGPVPPQMPTPAPAPYAPRRKGGDDCFGEPRGGSECFGQSRIPGIVVFAIIILLLGVFSLLQWILREVYPNIPGETVWGMFAIAIGILIIGLWYFLRRPRPRM